MYVGRQNSRKLQKGDFKRDVVEKASLEPADLKLQGF